MTPNYMNLLCLGNLVSSSRNRQQSLQIMYNVKYYCQVERVLILA